MSLLRKLFGGASAAEEIAAAEKLLAEGDPGSAKLRFEKAFSKTAKSDSTARSEIESRIDHSCDQIARRRLDEAKELLASGQYELAENEIDGALEVARGEQLRQELAELLDESDRTRLVSAGEANEPPPPPMSLYAAMRSSEPAEEDQALEYDSYGAAFEGALQLTFNGDAEGAIAQFQKLLREAKDPRYLHYELALAHRLAEQPEPAKAQFTTFLSRIAPDEGGIARIQAHVALANYKLEEGDADGAIDEASKSVEALPHSPTAFHELGNVLRRAGHPDEAVEVLRAALDLDGGDHWMMRQALGLALLEASRPSEARSELEQVVNVFVEHDDLRLLPVEATKALADLYETESQFTKGADLYRMLCEAAGEQTRAEFHLRTGQLLTKAGKSDAASTMFKRAIALAEQDEKPEIAASATAARAALASG